MHGMNGMFTLSNGALRQLAWLHHQLFKYANLLMQSGMGVCPLSLFCGGGGGDPSSTLSAVYFASQLLPERVYPRESAPSALCRFCASVPSPAEVCRTGSQQQQQQRRQLENVFIIILFGCA